MESKLSALVVDDEEKAVVLLTQLLLDSNHFGAVRSARSAAHAIDELQTWVPDLIFLDIKMPGMNGIRLLKHLHKQAIYSDIVFVTAYDKFALDAIRAHAFGYLMKPVNRDELHECIDHFKRRNTRPNITSRLDEFLQRFEPGGRLRINTKTGFFLIEPSEVVYCEADGNYTRIFTGEKSHLCTIQLGKVGEMLPDKGFVRLGRSIIVNFAFMTGVDRKKGVVNFEKNGELHSLAVSPVQIKEIEKHSR